jgi:riboflavin biosynthesis pyrimidine reductase
MRIVANLVIGADGATVLEGSSKALSSQADRSRFHALRKGASTILIGGNTARNEPYAKTPVPLVIVTASNQIPKEVRNNPLAHIWNISPLEAILRIGDESEVFGSEILVEGGVQLLQELLDGDVIDELFVTQTQQPGGSKQISLKTLTAGFAEKSCEEILGDKFWHFVRER